MAKNIKKRKYRIIPDNLFSNRKIKELEDKGDRYLIFYMKFYLKAQNYCGRNFVKMKNNGITLCEMCHKKLHQEQREKEKRKNG